MSAVVTDFAKSISTARPSITNTGTEYRLEIETLKKPGSGKKKIVAHLAVTGEGEELEVIERFNASDEIGARAKVIELNRESANFVVSCRGSETAEFKTGEEAEARAEEIRKRSAVHYTAKLLPASQGLIISARLIALFGEAMVTLLMTQSEDSIALLIQEPKVLGAMITRMAQNAAENDGLSVLKDLMDGVRADRVRMGKAEVEGDVSTHFDTHFAGRYAHLLEVALWVAHSNFLEP